MTDLIDLASDGYTSLKSTASYGTSQLHLSDGGTTLGWNDTLDCLSAHVTVEQISRMEPLCQFFLNVVLI